MTLTQRINAILGIRPEESQRMAVLLGSAFFLGLTLVFFNTASNAIFLTAFTAEGLPYVYIVNAILVAASGYIYAQLQKRYAFLGLFYGTVVLLTLSIFAFRALYQFTNSPWLTFALMAWYRQLLVFGMLGQWNLASYLFDMRQAKRLFALVYLGTMSAMAVGGLATATIVRLAGTVNLLLASGVCALLYLMILVISVPRFESKLAAPRPDSAEADLGKFLRDRYVVLIFLLRTASIVGSYLIEFLFYKQANQFYPDASSLASFLGSFVGASTLLMILVAAFLSGRFIARYGLKVAVPLTPVVLTLVATGMAVVSTLTGTGGGGFFLMVATLLLFSDVLQKSLATPLLSVLYQSLPAGQRSAVRTASESLIGSLAVVLSGVLLLALIRDVTTVTFVYLMLATLALWAAIAVLTYGQYATTLKHTVSRRFLQSVQASGDEISEPQLLLSRMQNLQPIDTAASLSPFEHEDSGELVLLDLLKHPDQEVQQAALERIETTRFTPALFEVRHLAIARETADPVRVAAFNAWCTLDAQYAPEAIAAYLDEPNLTIQAGAISALLKYAPAETKQIAEQRLDGLVNSPEVTQRILSANVIGASGSTDAALNAALAELLVDPSQEVRRAAIAATGRVKDQALWPTLLALLNNAALRPAAVVALGSATDTIMPEVETTYATASRPVQLGLIRVCGSLGTTRAKSFLEKVLDGGDGKARSAALLALYQCGYQGEHDAILARMSVEVAHAADVLTALVDIDMEAAALIRRALDDELHQVRRRIFLLLTLLYEPRVVLGAQQNLDHRSEERRSIALESLDVLLSAQLRRLIFPLIEDLPPARRLEQLDGDRDALSRVDRLKDLINQSWAGPWTRACAVYALARLPGPAIVSGVAEAEYRAMLGTIDKVLTLRRVSIFAQTSDEVLSEIALALEELTVKAGDTIVQKGEVGTSMYVIVSGEVRIHDGDRTLALLHERDIFGELAVLDAEPRSASVTAVTATQLFCLDHEALYELMVSRVEIVQGILRVLCQRVRAQTEKIVQSGQ